MYIICFCIQKFLSKRWAFKNRNLDSSLFCIWLIFVQWFSEGGISVLLFTHHGPKYIYLPCSSPLPSFQRRVLHQVHQVFHWLQVENAMKRPGLPYLHHSLSSSPSCGERSGLFPPLLRLRVQRSKLPCFLPNYLLHSLSSPLSPPGESALCCSSSSQPPPPAPQPLIILSTAQMHKCTIEHNFAVAKSQL